MEMVPMTSRKRIRPVPCSVQRIPTFTSKMAHVPPGCWATEKEEGSQDGWALMEQHLGGGLGGGALGKGAE